MTEPDLRASDATIAWCLRRASSCERLGELEHAALWAYVAAGTAAEFGHSWLASAPLEALLSRIGERLTPRLPVGRANAGRSLERWLHVFSMTFEIGGHTALARRWIARNPLGQRHSVALTFQREAAVEPGLADAVRASGGAVHSLAEPASLLRRATALRELAWETADVVVLHAHAWDVVPALAFAVPGGPPVLLTNHADHAFWVGCAASDLVVDIRDSGLALTRSLRGARGSAVLPVPLVDRGSAPRDRAPAAARLRDRSLLDRGLVLLTIGSPHKYLPHPRLDFPAVCVRIVEALGDCALIAVGASPSDPLWRQLRERTAGRVVAVGTDPDLAPWHAAADVYLEGFPVGSYTALLEAALAGRPFVRKPHLVSPSVLPIDRGALGAFEPPPDADAYVAAALALAGDADARDAQARSARADVLESHCGAGWDARLESLQRAAPAEHGVGLALDPPPLPAEFAAYRARIGAAGKRGAPLEFARTKAQEHGLGARTDVALLEAMRAPGG